MSAADSDLIGRARQLLGIGIAIIASPASARWMIRELADALEAAHAENAALVAALEAATNPADTDPPRSTE